MVCVQTACWWCIVTFTTVGYGDMYPRTGIGRLICSATMFVGIFFLAMPLTIVGSSFSDAWEKLQSVKLKMAAHDKLESKEWTPDYEKVRTLLRPQPFLMRGGGGANGLSSSSNLSSSSRIGQT